MDVVSDFEHQLVTGCFVSNLGCPMERWIKSSYSTENFWTFVASSVFISQIRDSISQAFVCCVSGQVKLLIWIINIKLITKSKLATVKRFNSWRFQYLFFSELVYLIDFSCVLI